MSEINGTNGDDTLAGGTGDDVLRGLGGYDVLRGLAGNDRLDGGIADDTLDGGSGGDTLRGGAGDDILTDTAGTARTGDDLRGEGGNDHLSASNARARAARTLLLDGGAGADVLDVTSHDQVDRVTLRGGAGDDRIHIAGRVTGTIDAGAGNDRIDLIGLSSVTITLGGGRDILGLGAGFFATEDIANAAIVVRNFAAGDRVDWADFLASTLENFDGRANPFATGHVRLLASGRDTLLQVDTTGGGDFWQTLATFTGVAPAAFDAAALGYNRDGSGAPGRTVAIGSASAGALSGFAGADRFDGAAGNDTLAGGAGDDRLRGGGGFDRLLGGFGDDRVYGGADGDTLIDSTGGDDALYGETGDDWLEIGRAFARRSSSVRLEGGSGNDRLYVYANETVDQKIVARGGPGDDLIFVRGRVHGLIEGNAGADRIDLDLAGGEYRIALGEGADTVSLSQQSYHGSLPATLMIEDFQADDTLDLAALFEAFVVGAEVPRGTDPFAAGFARLAQRGRDTLLQLDLDGGGEDFATLLTLKNISATSLTQGSLGYTPGTIARWGTAAADRFIGTATADILEGNAGNDLLIGAGGRDRLRGGDGRDTLEGGNGQDVLTGGAGADRFVFSVGSSGARTATADRITDFDAAAGDRIDLSAIPGAVPSFAVIDGNSFVSIDSDGDHRTDLMIRIDGIQPLALADFIL